jgi:hypothetical protein
VSNLRPPGFDPQQSINPDPTHLYSDAILLDGFSKTSPMNACHDLFKTYQEWRECSVLEGEAIRCADWPRVNFCQRAKMELQGRIIQFTQAARDHLAKTGGSWSEVEQRLRREVASLIDLENQNGETLAQVRCRALAEEAELDRSSRQLRQVRSYAPVVRSAWSSYS